MREYTLPADFLPEQFGLNWYMSQEVCISILQQKPTRRSAHFTEVSIVINNRLQTFLLLFDDNSLSKIEYEVAASQDFWDDYTEEELSQVAQDFQQRYETFVSWCEAHYGKPDFRGAWGEEAYPSEEIAWLITYWISGASRLQVELDQPDKEFPFWLKVSTCAYHLKDQESTKEPRL